MNDVPARPARRSRTVPILSALMMLAGVVFIATYGVKPIGGVFGAAGRADSYESMRGRSYGLDGHGRSVAPESFAGAFLWVQYAAPWCGYCPKQARETAAVAREFSRNITFLTVLTSGARPMAPTDSVQAADWARRYGMDPSLVVAGRLPSMSVPQYRFFGPEGRLLSSGTGLMRATDIKATIVQGLRRYE